MATLVARLILLPWLSMLFLPTTASTLPPVFKQCEFLTNDDAAGVLLVLPGGGWDNLRNKLSTRSVMAMDYTQCLFTEEGQRFLIPDNVTVQSIRSAKNSASFEFSSEFISNWTKDNDILCRGINADDSFCPALNGFYSERFSSAHLDAVCTKTVTTRMYILETLLKVSLLENRFDPAFKQRLIAIAEAISNRQQDDVLEYLAELLIRDYGTHIVTTVYAGASLVQEDRIRRSFAYDKSSKDLLAAARRKFLCVINGNSDADACGLDQFSKSYDDNTVYSNLASHGGTFFPGITVSGWQQNASNNLAVINREGEPLPIFITQETLPELTATTIRSLRSVIDRVIHKYYSLNTRPGCIDPAAINFNLTANVDEGSCISLGHQKLLFGGVFQTCENCRDGGTSTNPATDDYSCPNGYAKFLLHTKQVESNNCWKECVSRIAWVYCRRYVVKCEMVPRSTFWCGANNVSGVVPEGSAVLFGGLSNCPSYFDAVELFDGELTVCQSSDLKLGRELAIPFGGFFSCSQHNPWAGQNYSAVLNDTTGLQQSAVLRHRSLKLSDVGNCPPGMTQHNAIRVDDCPIHYCTSASTGEVCELPSLIVPPFEAGNEKHSKINMKWLAACMAAILLSIGALVSWINMLAVPENSLVRYFPRAPALLERLIAAKS